MGQFVFKFPAVQGLGLRDALLGEEVEGADAQGIRELAERVREDALLGGLDLGAGSGCEGGREAAAELFLGQTFPRAELPQALPEVRVEGLKGRLHERSCSPGPCGLSSVNIDSNAVVTDVTTVMLDKPSPIL